MNKLHDALKAYRAFRERRESYATVSDDHERLDAVENILYTEVLKQKMLHEDGNGRINNMAFTNQSLLKMRPTFFWDCNMRCI